MINIPHFEAVLGNKGPWIEPEDLITHDTVKWMCQWPTSSLQKIFHPSPPEALTDPNRVIRFRWEMMCAECGRIELKTTARSSLLRYVSFLRMQAEEQTPRRTRSIWRSFGNWLCVKCDHDRKAEEQAKMEASKEQEALNYQRRTGLFIEEYLDPGKSWKEGTDLRKACDMMSWSLSRCGAADIAEHIRGLSYDAFLATPYWKAIAYEVKRRAGFKCQLCSGSGQLHTHHRTYDIHGYELQHLKKELICLCGDCHQTFHTTGTLS